MKFKYALFFTLCSFMVSISVYGQTDMEWDYHGIGFTVPDNFKIETNNADDFTADNGNIFLSIIPFQDETVTTEDLADVVDEFAKELRYDRIHEGDEINIDDFTGYYIKGRKDGTNAVLLALLDKESSTNLLVVIVYLDGYEDAAIDIASSFYAYD